MGRGLKLKVEFWLDGLFLKVVEVEGWSRLNSIGLHSLHCNAATFYSVSISKPNLVSFAKKCKNFDKQIQTKSSSVWKKNDFLIMKNPKPIAVWFWTFICFKGVLFTFYKSEWICIFLPPRNETVLPQLQTCIITWVALFLSPVYVFHHCVFSNVSSNALLRWMHNHIGCICKAVLRCVFSNVF